MQGIKNERILFPIFGGEIMNSVSYLALEGWFSSITGCEKSLLESYLWESDLTKS